MPTPPSSKGLCFNKRWPGGQRPTFFQGQQRDGSAEASTTQTNKMRLLGLHLQAFASLCQVQKAVLQGTGHRNISSGFHGIARLGGEEGTWPLTCPGQSQAMGLVGWGGVAVRPGKGQGLPAPVVWKSPK